jgi:hypothetical protein
MTSERVASTFLCSYVSVYHRSEIDTQSSPLRCRRYDCPS